MVKKNVSGQKLRVFAFNKSNAEPVTGDAANITCEVSLNDAALSALADTNPTEVKNGHYLFDLAQSETNADSVRFYPASSTSGVQVVTVGVLDMTSTLDDLPGEINTLLSSKSVSVSNPVDPSTDKLTLVQRSDYKTTSAMGAIRKAIPSNFTGVSAGDVVRFGATEEDSGETIAKAGVVVDVSGSLFAQIELTNSETDKKASRQWRWELQHENGSGEISPIVANAEMELATSRADA